jgi:hypothetical protein
MNPAEIRKQASDFAQTVYEVVAEKMDAGSTPAELLEALNGATVSFFSSVEEVITAGGASAGELQKLHKVDEDQRMVWGWASVSTVRGESVIDTQGDIIETPELQKAAHEFMKDYRRGDEMHMIKGVGQIVDSVVMTKALQDALGVDLGMEGWLIGFKVESDEVWQKVKDGTYRAFSIGGSGAREAA